MIDDLDKKFYKIKDVAEFIGVPQSTLRFWEKEFPQCAPKRSSHNLRYYTSDDIRILQIIKFLLKEKGLKIEAAKSQLASNTANISRTLDIIETLENTRNDLERLLDAIDKRISKH